MICNYVDRNKVCLFFVLLLTCIIPSFIQWYRLDNTLRVKICLLQGLAETWLIVRVPPRTSGTALWKFMFMMVIYSSEGAKEIGYGARLKFFWWLTATAARAVYHRKYLAVFTIQPFDHVLWKLRFRDFFLLSYWRSPGRKKDIMKLKLERFFLRPRKWPKWGIGRFITCLPTYFSWLSGPFK